MRKMETLLTSWLPHWLEQRYHQVCKPLLQTLVTQTVNFLTGRRIHDPNARSRILNTASCEPWAGLVPYPLRWAFDLQPFQWWCYLCILVSWFKWGLNLKPNSYLYL
jgi:hypothetical protein